jgi:hypothetical protein
MTECTTCERRKALLAGRNIDEIRGIIWCLGIQWAAEVLEVPEDALLRFVGIDTCNQIAAEGQPV